MIKLKQILVEDKKMTPYIKKYLETITTNSPYEKIVKNIIINLFNNILHGKENEYTKFDRYYDLRNRDERYIKEILDSYIKPYLKLDYPDINVYRAIMFKTKIINKEMLKINPIGIYWTWNEDEAFPIFGDTQSLFYYVYCGKVNYKNVMWNYSIDKNIGYRYKEQELGIKKGSPIKIYNILEKKLDTKGFNSMDKPKEISINFNTNA
jgi:hypothetical protein